MKKFLFLSFVSLAVLFSGCEKVDTPNIDDNDTSFATRLQGSWVLADEVYIVNVIFNESEWFQTDGRNSSEGTYTLDGDVLTMRSGDSLADLIKVIMPCDNVLVMRFQNDMGDDWGLADEFELFFRENSEVNLPASDIQGKWFWHPNGDTSIVRMSLEITDSTFDFIIPLWRERMKGTFEYSNGRINFHVKEFLTRENPEGRTESLENLYQGWSAPTEESSRTEPSFGYDFRRSFVPVEGVAYAMLYGGPTYLVKQ